MSILFGKSTHKLLQRQSGRYIDGVWTEPSTIESVLFADIQPMTDFELENLLIGDKNVGKIKIYCNIDLNVMNELQNKKGDLVVWDANNETYEIIGQLKYNNNLINHNKYVAELRKPRQ